MKALQRVLFSVALAACLSAGAYAAAGWSNVAINGQRLTVAQLYALEQQIGTRIVPGAYIADARGCWLNLSTGQAGCLGQNGSYLSRYGSGERNSDGSWHHRSNSADMGVGGTADGCIYTTTGWSNC